MEEASSEETCKIDSSLHCVALCHFAWFLWPPSVITGTLSEKPESSKPPSLSYFSSSHWITSLSHQHQLFKKQAEPARWQAEEERSLSSSALQLQTTQGSWLPLESEWILKNFLPLIHLENSCGRAEPQQTPSRGSPALPNANSLALMT